LTSRTQISTSTSPAKISLLTSWYHRTTRFRSERILTLTTTKGICPVSIGS